MNISSSTDHMRLPLQWHMAAIRKPMAKSAHSMAKCRSGKRSAHRGVRPVEQGAVFGINFLATSETAAAATAKPSNAITATTTAATEQHEHDGGRCLADQHVPCRANAPVPHEQESGVLDPEDVAGQTPGL